MPEKKEETKEEKTTDAGSAAAKRGDTVKINYTGTFDDGTVFDSSEKREPIEFTIGQGKVIKGFDDAVVGMTVGEEKEIKVTPADGYGEHDENLVREFQKDKLPKDPAPDAGMVLSLRSPDGQTILAKIDKVDDDKVFLDFNHPLAGKNLNFKLKLVEVKA